MYSRGGLNAQTGDPNTTRSYSETSVDDGSIVVFFLLLAILQHTRKRVSRVIGCRVTDFDQACIKCRSNMPGYMAGVTGPAMVNNTNFYPEVYWNKKEKIPEKIIF